MLRLGEQRLQLGGQCREWNELSEIRLGQFADFAVVISQWFWVCIFARLILTDENARFPRSQRP